MSDSETIYWTKRLREARFQGANHVVVMFFVSLFISTIIGALVRIITRSGEITIAAMLMVVAVCIIKAYRDIEKDDL